MGTIQLSPGSIGFTKGSDRSGHQVSGQSAMAAGTAGFGSILRRPVAAVWVALIRLQAGYEMRRHLQTLDDRMLRDIGLTRRQVNTLTRRQADKGINEMFQRL